MARGVFVGSQGILFIVMRGCTSCGSGLVVAAHRLGFSEESGILVPQPGIELASPALQGRFLTTRPPGKSLFSINT